MQLTDVHFASLLSSGFTTMAVINPPERKLAKRTNVQCPSWNFENTGDDGNRLLQNYGCRQ